MGAKAELHLGGMDARVAQHQFDHPNGIMFLDHIRINPRSSSSGPEFDRPT
jgi:peptide deformylase